MHHNQTFQPSSFRSKIKSFATIAIIFIFATVFPQNADRKYLSKSVAGGMLTVNVSDGSYQIRIFSNNILETSFLPTGEEYNPNSHAVILKREPFSESYETNNSIEYGTSGIAVKIQKSPFQITYLYKNKLLLSEKNGYIKKDSTEVIDFNLSDSEALYGGGARVLGMNRRSNRLTLYNRAHYGYETRAELMNFTIPIVLSSKMYAVHFDNAPAGFLDLDSKNDNTLAYETISGRKTYQVIASDSWQNIIENYTLLTGRQPLPPRWAFGNFASRFGYHSEKEVRETVKKFKDDKIPLDAIILDLFWFGKEVKGTMGNLEFHRDSFPDPKKMIADLNKSGVKTILITEPFILTTSKRWNEAVSKNILATDGFGKPFTFDFFFGNTGLIDIFKPEGKAWFWNIYKNLIAEGVGGWWGDLGEPEVHPAKLRHAKGTADELHNIYGHQWAKLVFDGYQKDFPSQRPFILMRSGFSGSQRYGMIPWSGDVSRSWGGLSGQTEIALQMGMQGLGYMHSDLGGFAGATLDDELYTRWLQYGVFQPIFRPHAQEEVASEPVFREEKTKALAKKSIELRYALMPYNYTIAFDNNQKGTPLMRPLLFEEPGDVKVQLISDEYLWGNDFLVAPIMQPGIKEKKVYFPKSSNWFDFFTNEKFDAGTIRTLDIYPDRIPVFVRGGAFIPMIKPIQTTLEYSTKNLDVHFFYDKAVSHSTGKLYDDNGELPNAFENDQYEMLYFESNSNGNMLTLKIHSEKGKTYEVPDRKMMVIIHNVYAKPSVLLIDRKNSKFAWNSQSKTVEISVSWKKESKKEIQIQL